MSKRENSATPGFRKVVVDIATHDDGGKRITDAMLSSGGARDHGSIVKQYTNPQPYEQAPIRSDKNDEFDAYTQRGADRQQRREDMAEERRRREIQRSAEELLRFLVDGAVWLGREFVAPWVTRTLDERKARNLALRESKAASNARVESPTDDERAVLVAESEAGIAESAAENVTLAPVVQIDDYRRSA